MYLGVVTMRVHGARWRCRACRAKFSVTSGHPDLEGIKFPLHIFLMCVFMFAIDMSFDAIIKASGVAWDTLASSILFLLCAYLPKAALANYQMIGGPGFSVEADETQFGRKRKGLKGHPTNVRLDLWGVVWRETGELVLVPFDKWKRDSCDNRFGPASRSEVMPIPNQWIKPGGDFFSDGLKCYKDLESTGSKVYQVSHKNEFVREEGTKKVHSQTIDGLWDVLKNKFRGKFGVHDLPTHIDEFVWRRQHRLSPNLFLDMLDLYKIQHPLSS